MLARVLNRNIAINITQCRLGGCKVIAAAQWNTIPSTRFSTSRGKPPMSSALLSALSSLPTIPLCPHAFWRDLRGTPVTHEELPLLSAALQALQQDFTVTSEPWGVVDSEGGTVVSGHFAYCCEAAGKVGRGYISLRDGHLDTLFTQTLHRLDCLPSGSPVTFSGSTPVSVIIVGAGQAGLSLSARLNRLGIRSTIVEGNNRVGDNWRQRYEGLHLHDPKNAAAMPYQPPPDDAPLLLPKDVVADYLEAYAVQQHAEVLLSSQVVSAAFCDDSKCWSVTVETGGEEQTLSAQHFVIGTGFSGFPHMPDFPSKSSFGGRFVHSSSFSAAEAQEETAVVIGSNTSAHDVAQSLTDAGVHVTMIQRSPTTVISIEAHTHINLAAFTDGALTGDQRRDAVIAGFHSQSYKRLAETHRDVVVPVLKKKDAGLCEGLEKAGFRCDWGDDESGLVMKFLRRGTGYYMDVGASAMITDGRVKVVGGEVTRVGEGSVFVTGAGGEETEVSADLVVACTGYTNMQAWAEKFCGEEVAGKVGRVYGYGSGTVGDPLPYVGEMRGLWKESGQEALWMFGGNFTQCRFYSRVTALLIQEALLSR